MPRNEELSFRMIPGHDFIRVLEIIKASKVSSDAVRRCTNAQTTVKPNYLSTLTREALGIVFWLEHGHDA